MAYYEDEDRVGFRFKPTDEELVGYFLYQKVVAGQPLRPPHDGIVHVFNKPLGNIIPWKVWEEFGGPCLFDEGGLYFFSELETSTQKASRRIKRKIALAGGTWSEASSREVMDRNGNPIGKRRYFRYENCGKEHHGDWLLDEYSLLNVASMTVLCRLRKKTKGSYCSSQEFDEEKPKQAYKKARKDSGPVRPQNPSVINADYEEPPQSYSTTPTSTLTSSLVVYDESNINERVSDNYLHDQALMSNTDYDPVPNNFYAGYHDHGNALVASDASWFGAGGTNEEQYLIGIDELLAPMEKPSFLQELPLPTENELGAEKSIGLEDMLNQPTDDSSFWSSCLKMSEDTSSSQKQFCY